MRMYDLIEKKKRGYALDKAEICWMIQSYTCLLYTSLGCTVRRFFLRSGSR